jgi:hypothetical protein
LKEKPENNFSRERKITVWVCSDECAIQAMGIAKWGSATHKWPISLAQYRAMKPLEKGNFSANPTRGIRPSKIAKMRALESRA